MQPEKSSGPAGSVPVASYARSGRTSLPNQRTLISWLFFGRLTLAVATLIGSALVWREVPAVAFALSVGVLVTIILTAYGGWWTLVRENEPTYGFLLTQSLVDLGLVTLLVHFGGIGSVFPTLYVLVITAYAVLMPLRPAMIVPLLATILYVSDAVWGQPVRLDLALWGQVAVFTLVFAIVAVLGRRLRAAGMEQATLEGELRRVRLEAEDILQNIRSGVLTVDGLGRLAFINPTAQLLLQLDGNLLLGRPVLEELKLRSQELWAAIVAGIQSGHKVSRGEGMVVHERKRFPIGLSTTAFQQEAHESPSVTAIFTDISDTKQLQELHLRAERLEAVAALSSSLAHEIRNPLASIRSSVEQLARGKQAGEDERVLAGLIVRESDRLSRLLSEFLDFSRVRATKSEPVDLHAVAAAAVRLVRAHPDCNADASLTVEGGRTILEGDEDLLHRVVANLVLNAVQAAPEPVRVSVRIGPAPPGEVPGGAEIGRAVRLQVRDNGPGIPAEIRERLFEPFVSCRPGGSGLGLAIVQRAVEAHRGLVLVDSAPDTGTTFTIFLPTTWVAEVAA